MRKILLKKLLLIILLLPSFAFAGRATLSDRSDVHQFINHMVNDYGFNGPALANLFNNVKVRKDILTSINRPAESNPWYQYRARFITPTRVDQGVVFWSKHAKTLAYAEDKYGVPANIIVAIIGVETNYGQVKGNYRVIDTLSTLAFNYPSRAKFFRYELEQFLLLSREQHFNPNTVLGSYAGAIGMPQFMPSVYRRLAVGHQNQHADLINNYDDAIISVANYFKNHGWQTNQPVIASANLHNDGYKKLINTTLKTPYTVQQLKNHGVTTQAPIAATTPANLVQLQGENGQKYLLGFNNLYTITAYNPRINYAMAVYELGKTIAAKREQQLAKNAPAAATKTSMVVNN